MDNAVLPLNFYCRNARLSLKKASFSKKSQLLHDELCHLRKFETLVAASIPAHPHYDERKTDKQIVELNLCLGEARKRIQELEAEHPRGASPCNTSSTTTGVASSSARSVVSTSNSSSRFLSTDKSTPRSFKSSADFNLSCTGTSGTPKSSIGTPITPKSSASAFLLRAKLSPSRRSFESPKKLHHGYGTWTSNPVETHCHKGSATSSSPDAVRDAFLSSSVRPSAPDQSAQTILGGCAILANHLKSFEDGGKDVLRRKSLEFTRSMSPSSKRCDQDRSASDWAPSPSKARDRERVDYVELSHAQDDTNSADKSTIKGHKFRFASDYFEKKLQERMSRKTHLGEGRVSPSRTKTASSEKDSNCEEKPGRFNPGADVSTSGSLKGKFRRLAAQERERKYAETPDQEDNWSRKILPTVDSKLTHEMLRSTVLPDNPAESSKRKKHKRRGVLGTMDDVVRKAIESDSDIASNLTSSPQYQSTAKSPRTRGDRAKSKSPRMRADREASTKSPRPRGADREMFQQGKDTDCNSNNISRSQHQQQPSGLQGLQVEALEKKITSLQSLVCDLKDSIEGFTSRVEEEGEAWQCKIQGLESQFKSWKDDTDKELRYMRGSIKEEVNMKLDDLTKGLDKAERLFSEAESRKDGSKQRVDNRLEDFNARLDCLRRHVDTMATDIKSSVMRDVKDRVGQTVKEMGCGVKNDLDILELGISKDMENMRKELHDKIECLQKQRRNDKHDMEAFINEKMDRRFSSSGSDMSLGNKDKIICELKNELKAETERLRRTERQQIEAIIEEKICKKLMDQPMESKEIDNVKSELCLVWTEIDLLSKGRSDIKTSIGELTQIAEQAKDSINKEQVLLKTEHASLRKQLQYFKKESMQSRSEIEDIKKEMEQDMQELKCSFEKMKEQEECMKSKIENLREAEDELSCQNQSLQKMIEKMREDLVSIRAESCEFEIRRSHSDEEMCDKILIMEKIEKLSELYLGGLDDVKDDLTNTKSACENRIRQLECSWLDLKKQQESNAESEESLRDLVLEGLETRMTRLEEKLEQKPDFEEEKYQVEHALAVIQRDRDQAACCLAQVTDASLKAGKLVTDSMDTMQSEMASLRRHSLIVQESLASEKDAAASAVAEVMRLRDQVGMEKEGAICVILDAKARTLEFLDILEKERIHLQEAAEMVDKDRDAVAAAVSKAAEALEEIMKIHKQGQSVQDGIKDCVSTAHERYSQEVEEHMHQWRKSMVDEFNKAKSYVEGIEEEKRKSVNHIDGWKKMMSEELHKAKAVTEGIEQEKRKTLSITETLALQEKSRFEHHVKTTETTIQDLMRTIDVMGNALDQKFQKMKDRFAYAEQEDERMKSEIKDIKDKLNEVHQSSEALRQDMNERVAQMDNRQTDIAQTVDQMQSNTGDLEKTAATWLEKYETACRVFQDIDKRISSLENASILDNPDEQQQDANGGLITELEKQKMISLYKQLSVFVKKMKERSGKDAEDNTDWPEDAWSKSFDSKLSSLQNLMEQMEAETVSNLRALEMKTDELCLNTQSAENKCSALGAELVKVFRMLASSRKESPTKGMMVDADDCRAHIKAKSPCNHCRKTALNAQIEALQEAHNHAIDYKQQENAAELINYEGIENEGMNIFMENRNLKDCVVHGKLNHDHQTINERSQSGIADRTSPTGKLTRRNNHTKGELIERPEEFATLQMLKRNNNELKVVEGKLPITHESKKETTLHSGSGKNCQSTNIRLEAGKIQVNVSHRSAVMSGTRTAKRGDTTVSTYNP